MSLLRGLWNSLEGIGLMADISNWTKLRFISKFMGGNPPIVQAQAQTPDNRQPIQASDKGVFDEYLVLAALFDGVDMSQKVTREVIEVFASIMGTFRTRDKHGEAKMLMSIVGIKESEITSREIEDADDTGNQAPTLAARRRGKKVKETTVRRNDRGTRVLLGFYSLGITDEERVCNSVKLLDTLGILENPTDKLAATKKGLHEKWDKAFEATREYFGENAVATANMVTQHIVGNEAFEKMLTSETVASIQKRYLAIDDMEEKLKLGEEYSQALQTLVHAYFGKAPEQQQQSVLDFAASLPKKKAGIWCWIECIALAIIVIVMAGILFNG